MDGAVSFWGTQVRIGGGRRRSKMLRNYSPFFFVGLDCELGSSCRWKSVATLVCERSRRKTSRRFRVRVQGLDLCHNQRSRVSRSWTSSICFKPFFYFYSKITADTWFHKLNRWKRQRCLNVLSFENRCEKLCDCC
jgi:hypothetical protein